MSLFGFDYEKAGIGISKSAPKKKNFFVFFELYFRKFWKLVKLNIITFLFCLPIVTIGPALAGMTKVLRNYILERNSFIFHDFWKGFSKNLKKSIPVGIADVLFAVSAYSSLIIYPEMASSSESGGILFIILCIISLSFAMTLLIMNFYIMPMIIATDLKLINIIKNSFFLTCVALKKNFITLVIIMVISLVIVIMTLLTPLTIIVIPFWLISFIGFIIMFNTYPQIQKYVIDPYYKERGQVNPEYSLTLQTDDEIVFTDMGGREAPIESKSKKNKTIS